MAERLDHATQVEVRRAEVVAPLADAVGLVDREQRNFELFEDRDERVVFQLLRRDEDDFHATRGDARDPGGFLVLAQGRVQRDRIEDATTEIINEQLKRACDVVRAEEEAIARLVSLLLERETVDSDEILECFAGQDVTQAA